MFSKGQGTKYSSVHRNTTTSKQPLQMNRNIKFPKSGVITTSQLCGHSNLKEYILLHSLLGFPNNVISSPASQQDIKNITGIIQEPQSWSHGGAYCFLAAAMMILLLHVGGEHETGVGGNFSSGRTKLIHCQENGVGSANLGGFLVLNSTTILNPIMIFKMKSHRVDNNYYHCAPSHAFSSPAVLYLHPVLLIHDMPCRLSIHSGRIIGKCGRGVVGHKT